MNKKNKDSEISKSQININGVDIDKILISYKFGYGKKGYKQFINDKNDGNSCPLSSKFQI